MYERLRDCPALSEYPSRIPAEIWNVWRRYWMRFRRPTCFGMEDLPPMSMLLDEREWVLVDSCLYDMPIVAWTDFQDAGRTALHEPVSCTVRDYHQGAPKVRNKALLLMAEELEARLHHDSRKDSRMGTAVACSGLTPTSWDDPESGDI